MKDYKIEHQNEKNMEKRNGCFKLETKNSFSSLNFLNYSIQPFDILKI